MWRRIVQVVVAPLFAVMLLASCRVDVAVDLQMAQNGSGALKVTITADAQLVSRTPGLAADLRLDDLTDAGWATEGPVGTPDGGLSIVLTHTFDTAGQATALIESLNGTDGPFRDMTFTRDAHTASIDYTLSGTAKANGLESVADTDLIVAIGATPYVADMDADDLTADDVIGLTFSAELPGSVTETSSGRVDEPLQWTVPFDDTVVEVSARSTASLERSRGWTVLATLLFVALGLWVLVSIAFIVFIARRQHTRRRRRRSLANLIEMEGRDDDHL